MVATQSIALNLKAKLFRGLADPSRLAIVEALRDGPKTVGELVLAIGLSQPNTSSHLACLKDCGLVTSRPEGRRVRYTLADARMEGVLRMVEDVLADVAAQVYACTRYQGQEKNDDNSN